MTIQPAIALGTWFLLFSPFLCAGNTGPLDGNDPSAAPSDIYQALSVSVEIAKDKTGVSTLENGGESLLARLWFFDHAQQSIDIQYYSFAKDVTGLIASDHLVRAAERGVKVRILVDDAAGKMYSYQIQMLDSHENIEVRIYNAGLRMGRPDRRLMKLAKNADRLLRRMHNKTLCIDGQACILGGRNIADEYFDYDHRYNFRDRDVLLIGKAAAEVKGSFEKFWNDPLTVIYADLSGKSGKKWYSDPDRFEKLHWQAMNAKEFSPEMRERINTFPEKLKGEGGQLIWVSTASFISDIPGKNEDRKDRKGGICPDSIMSLIRQAKNSVLIESPYFILTEEYEQMITAAVQRGVKVRLLTNSLASIDNISAFSAYQQDRKEILKTGMEIFEFKPHAPVRFQLMLPEVQKDLNYSPVYGFHAKTVVIDGAVSVIGSFNFDPRSANYNTECIAVVRSEKEAGYLLKQAEKELLPENAWQISDHYNPDHEAGIKKRFKAFFWRIIPHQLL